MKILFYYINYYTYELQKEDIPQKIKDLLSDGFTTVETIK